jgi:hypothetical protein
MSYFLDPKAALWYGSHIPLERTSLTNITDMEPDCTNYWNRIQAEKSYLLTEAAPDFRHKGRMLQALPMDMYGLANWWVKLFDVVTRWIGYAMEIDVPV